MAKRRLDVVVAGLAVVDVIGRPIDVRSLPRPGSLKVVESVTLTTGGNVSNCGIDLSKLGFRVGAITRVGNDALGDFIRRELQRYRIEDGGVITDSRLQTSATLVSVGKDGERTFMHTRGCLRNFRVRDVLRQMPMISAARMFALGYFGLLPEAEPEFGALFRSIKQRTGCLTLLDTGGIPRRTPGILRSVLPHVDFFIPSHEEASALTGKTRPADIVASFRKAGARGIVGVKLGSQGCYISTCTRSEHVLPVRVRNVIDATGAGDAFVAGFIAATLRGREPFAAATIANRVAASCVTAVGASTAIRPFATYRP